VFYGNNFNLFIENTDIIKKNIGDILDANKEVGLGVN
jgi:hypothetical protein